MAGSFVELMNKTLPKRINRGGSVHTALVGQEDFIPESTISDSSNFNCGALCNEFEFARKVTRYYASALRIDNAEGEELDALITNLIDLPRRSRSEEDAVYRSRFKFLVVAKTNYRRITKWSILDSVSYFILPENVEIVEPFNDRGQYFQVRLKGIELSEGALSLDDEVDGYLDNNFLAGPGIGAEVSYIGALVDRVKAAGVDFDLLFISQYQTSLTSDMRIGTVQRYMTSDSTIHAIRSVTKTADAEIVT